MIQAADFLLDTPMNIYNKVADMPGKPSTNTYLTGIAGFGAYGIAVLVILSILAFAPITFAQGSITGTVTNSDASTPANGEISFIGYLDDTDEEIRIDLSIGAGFDNGNWFDDFQNYLTEAAGNPYDYHFYNSANGEGLLLSGSIPNNSFEQQNIVLASVAWPGKPEFISGGSISNEAVRITWNPVAGLTYHVYRRDGTSDGSFFRIDDPTGSLANPGISGGEYIDNTLNLNDEVDYLIIAEDAGGNLSPHSDILTVVHTGADAPVITCPDDIAISCQGSIDPSVTGQATATDESDPDPVVTYTDETVSGSCDNSFTINRTWRAEDFDNNFATCLQVITVSDETAPEITCPADLTVDCSASIDPAQTGTASATDNCDGSPVIAYTDAVDNNAITRTWTATDVCGNVSSCDQNITIEDTAPPQITDCPADVVLSCDADTSVANTGVPQYTDDCGTSLVLSWTNEVTAGSCPQNATIARTFTVADESGNSSDCTQTIEIIDNTAPEITCPNDISIPFGGSTDPSETGSATATDNCTNVIEITYSDNTTGNTITRTWNAVDECGNGSTCDQTMTIQGSGDPVVTCPGDITIDCSASSDPSNTGTPTVNDDNDPNPTLTYEDEVVPGSCNNTYVINRTWTAEDVDGNTGSCLQTINVIDETAPLITCPGDLTVDCAGSIDPAATGTATAEDNCDENPVITYSDNAEGNVITRTWTATDACGNNSSCDQVITIEDTTSPQITECPADIVLACGDDTSAAENGLPAFSDDCDAAPILSWTDEVTAGDCPQNMTIVRTFAVTDNTGNFNTCVQTIEVIDDIAPVISCPDDAVVPFGGNTDPSETGTATAEDNCDDNPQIDYSDVQNINMIERTWTAADECGNIASCVQTLTLSDYAGPVWYVSLDGDNGNDGDLNAPFGTIQFAIDIASTGDTVMVLPGVYTGEGNHNLNPGGKAIVITSPDGPASSIIQCEGQSSAPCRGFNFISGETSETVLEGLTIRMGYALDLAGGILCDGSSPTIRNCILDGNTAVLGGGAITCRNSSSPIIENTVFTDNHALRYGGAISCLNNSSPIISNCEFSNNTGDRFGGAIYVVSSAPQINYSIFNGNSAQFNGGAIVIQEFGPVHISNCTFYGNNCGTQTGGIIFNDGDSLAIENSIIAFNINGRAVTCNGANAKIDITCSDIFGNDDGDWFGCISGLNGTSGNFSADPDLCDPGTGNFRISELSLCAPANSECGVLIGAEETGCIPTDIADDDSDNRLPAEFGLDQNYPNPFNPSTNISFTIPVRSDIKLEIFNISGQRVTTLYEGTTPPGHHTLVWDGKDDSGRTVPTGIYLYRLKAGDFVSSRKMLLLK